MICLSALAVNRAAPGCPTRPVGLLGHLLACCCRLRIGGRSPEPIGKPGPRQRCSGLVIGRAGYWSADSCKGTSDEKPVEPGMGEAAVGPSATERVDLYGFPSADFIRASSHADRVKHARHMSAPDRTNRTPENPCTDGCPFSNRASLLNRFLFCLCCRIGGHGSLRGRQDPPQHLV